MSLYKVEWVPTETWGHPWSKKGSGHFALVGGPVRVGTVWTRAEDAQGYADFLNSIIGSRWVPVEEGDPAEAGKYVVETVSTSVLRTRLRLEARFTPGRDGKRGSFDVHNQLVVRWLYEAR